MHLKQKTVQSDVATVYIAENGEGSPLEFVESVQPPIPQSEKWVLIISTLYGCPVKCRFCDAGQFYRGIVSLEDLLGQVDIMISNRYPDGIIPVPKFKIQLARMGEPALNPAVLDFLRVLPEKYTAPGLLPTLSTIAPASADRFFKDLIDIKQSIYAERFQMQFSIHTTDEKRRDWLIPIKKWSFSAIADYGADFYQEQGRKITLNFALAEGQPVDPDIMLKYFDPSIFLVKVTPVNPTARAKEHGLDSHVHRKATDYPVIDRMREAGYDVILSIGDWEENEIGSNCGQYITNYLKAEDKVDGYSYMLEVVGEK
ncbi:radical SAM protein [bacterium]|nr:radical SAM protein [bacterium]